MLAIALPPLSVGTPVPNPIPSPSTWLPPIGALEIEQALPIHAGRYTCTARNSVGVARKHMVLTVQGKDPSWAHLRPQGKGNRTGSTVGASAPDVPSLTRLIPSLDSLRDSRLPAAFLLAREPLFPSPLI